MAIDIELMFPVFKCQSDEDVFFHRLSEIAGIEKVIDTGSRLLLSIADERMQDARKDIDAICDIWHTSCRPSP